jgi:hypothetical protein
LIVKEIRTSSGAAVYARGSDSQLSRRDERQGAKSAK